MYAPLWLCLSLLVLPVAYARPSWYTGIPDNKDDKISQHREVDVPTQLLEAQHAVKNIIEGAKEEALEHLAAMKQEHMQLVREHFYNALEKRLFRLDVLKPLPTLHYKPCRGSILTCFHLPKNLPTYSKLVPITSINHQYDCNHLPHNTYIYQECRRRALILTHVSSIPQYITKIHNIAAVSLQKTTESQSVEANEDQGKKIEQTTLQKDTYNHPISPFTESVPKTTDVFEKSQKLDSQTTTLHLENEILGLKNTENGETFIITSSTSSPIEKTTSKLESTIIDSDAKSHFDNDNIESEMSSISDKNHGSTTIDLIAEHGFTTPSDMAGSVEGKSNQDVTYFPLISTSSTEANHLVPVDVRLDERIYNSSYIVPKTTPTPVAFTTDLIITNPTTNGKVQEETETLNEGREEVNTNSNSQTESGYTFLSTSSVENEINIIPEVIQSEVPLLAREEFQYSKPYLDKSNFHISTDSPLILITLGSVSPIVEKISTTSSIPFSQWVDEISSTKEADTTSLDKPEGTGEPILKTQVIEESIPLSSSELSVTNHQHLVTKVNTESTNLEALSTLKTEDEVVNFNVEDTKPYEDGIEDRENIHNYVESTSPETTNLEMKGDKENNEGGVQTIESNYELSTSNHHQLVSTVNIVPLTLHTTLKPEDVDVNSKEETESYEEVIEDRENMNNALEYTSSERTDFEVKGDNENNNVSVQTIESSSDLSTNNHQPLVSTLHPTLKPDVDINSKEKITESYEEIIEDKENLNNALDYTSFETSDLKEKGHKENDDESVQTISSLPISNNEMTTTFGVLKKEPFLDKHLDQPLSYTSQSGNSNYKEDTFYTEAVNNKEWYSKPTISSLSTVTNNPNINLERMTSPHVVLEETTYSSELDVDDKESRIFDDMSGSPEYLDVSNNDLINRYDVTTVPNENDSSRSTLISFSTNRDKSTTTIYQDITDSILKFTSEFESLERVRLDGEISSTPVDTTLNEDALRLETQKGNDVYFQRDKRSLADKVPEGLFLSSSSANTSEVYVSINKSISPTQYASTILEILPMIREGYKNNAFGDEDKKIIHSIFGEMKSYLDSDSLKEIEESASDLLMGDEKSIIDDDVDELYDDESSESQEGVSPENKRRLRRSDNPKMLSRLVGSLKKLSQKHYKNTSIPHLKRRTRNTRSTVTEKISEKEAILGLLQESSEDVQLEVADDEDDDEYEYYEDDDESEDATTEDSYEDSYDDNPSITELIKLARKHSKRKKME